jgi:AcrR family transcriptional regulator
MSQRTHTPRDPSLPDADAQNGPSVERTNGSGSRPLTTSVASRVPTEQPYATDAAIIASARDEFVRYGFRRANVEQIAKRAGVSRITVYRRFSDKEGLLRAVILAYLQEFAERFDAVWYGTGTAADRIVEAVLISVKEIREHPLLVTIMRSEPEQVVNQIATEGQEIFERLRTLLTARIDGLIERGEIGSVDSARASEVMLRLGYSIALLPYGLIPGTKDRDIRAFARDFIVPLFNADTARSERR